MNLVLWVRRAGFKAILCALILSMPLASGIASSAASKAESAIGHVHALAVDADGKTLWMGTHGGLLRSEDGGETWRPVRLSEKHSHLDIMSIVPDAMDPRTVYIGTHEAGIFKTEDGGALWNEANRGLGGVDVHGLAYDPNRSGKLHAAVREGAEGIYRTLDAGKKWTRVDDGPPGEVKVLASVNISTGMGGIYLYAGTSEGLFRGPDCF